MWNKQSTYSDWWCSELQKNSEFWDFKVWNRQWTFKIYGRLNFYIILHEFYGCFLFWDALLWEGFFLLLLHVLLILLCAIFVWSESNFLSQSLSKFCHDYLNRWTCTLYINQWYLQNHMVIASVFVVVSSSSLITGKKTSSSIYNWNHVKNNLDTYIQ